MREHFDNWMGTFWDWAVPTLGIAILLAVLVLFLAPLVYFPITKGKTLADALVFAACAILAGVIGSSVLGICGYRDVRRRVDELVQQKVFHKRREDQSEADVTVAMEAAPHAQAIALPILST